MDIEHLYGVVEGEDIGGVIDGHQTIVLQLDVESSREKTIQYVSGEQISTGGSVIGVYKHKSIKGE